MVNILIYPKELIVFRILSTVYTENMNAMKQILYELLPFFNFNEFH